jgi:hypothetical protein
MVGHVKYYVRLVTVKTYLRTSYDIFLRASHYRYGRGATLPRLRVTINIVRMRISGSYLHRFVTVGTDTKFVTEGTDTKLSPSR